MENRYDMVRSHKNGENRLFLEGARIRDSVKKIGPDYSYSNGKKPVFSGWPKWGKMMDLRVENHDDLCF